MKRVLTESVDQVQDITGPSFGLGSAPLVKALRVKIKGEVRFDPLSRTLYATDASIYEIIPLGVVLPKAGALGGLE